MKARPCARALRGTWTRPHRESEAPAAIGGCAGGSRAAPEGAACVAVAPLFEPMPRRPRAISPAERRHAPARPALSMTTDESDDRALGRTSRLHHSPDPRKRAALPRLRRRLHGERVAT